MVKINKIYLAAICLFCSCSTKLIQIKAKENLSKSIRLDGFYYCNTPMYNNHLVTSIFILYQNGVIYYTGSGGEYNSKKEVEENMEKLYKKNYEIILSNGGGKGNYGFWGQYEINGDSIYIKMQMLGPGKKSLEKWGDIKDVELFYITQDKEYKRGKIEVYKSPKYYYFKHSDFKPDSTNIFYK